MKILRLPSVVIFLLVFVSPLFLVAPLRMIINLIFNDPEFSNLILFLGLHFLFVYTWELAIGLQLSPLLPTEQSFRKTVYIAFFASRIFLLLYVFASAVTTDDFNFLTALSLLPAALLWYAASLFIRYQNAKIVRAVELNRRVALNDFIIYFILHNMLAIGIWVIQGSVNQSLRQRAVSAVNRTA